MAKRQLQLKKEMHELEKEDSTKKMNWF